MIDSTFRNIDRLFVLLIKNGDNEPAKDSFDKYYMPLVEIKYFIELINNKPLFHQPVKNKQETYEKLVEISGNDDYRTGNVLDSPYHQNNYKLIGIVLSRQTNVKELEEDHDASIFSISKGSKKLL